MSSDITKAFVKQFTDGITMLQQQSGSNLRGGVSAESGITGDRAFFDQIDSVAMSQVTNRHGDTVLTDTPHRRRMVTLTPYDIADMVDRPDLVRTLNDPTNSYVKNFASAAGRQIDDTIITAFNATASTGVDGSGTAPFDSDFQVAVGGANMSLEKLRQARKLLEAAENMEDDGEYKWYIVMSANQREALLSDTTVTSADYNTVKALVDGSIESFMGFEFLKSERLPATGNNRSCFAWCKSSMKLGVGQEPRGFIDVRPDKRHGTQIRYELDIGATRLDEKGVVEIVCDETA